MKRIKTEYPGVYYISGKAKTNNQPERIYYINYYKEGIRKEEKAGRQFQNQMTPARANNLRSLRIEGKELTNEEKREQKRNVNLVKNVMTVEKLWNEFYYQKKVEGLKSLKDDKGRYNNHIKSIFGDLEPDKITSKQVDELKNKISEYLKPATVKQVLVLLKRILNYGIKKQLIKPVLLNIEMPKVNNIKTLNFFLFI